MSDLWTMAMGGWCDEFAELMLPFNRLALSRADLVFMGNGTPGFSFTVNDPCPDGFSQLIKSNLTMAMAHYPMGAHLRLDLCSFRTGAATPRVVGVNGALWLMRQANPRVSGVVRRALSDGQSLSLFVFPWLPIPQWAEFRIFVQKGKVIGISQAHIDTAFEQIVTHETAIKAALDSFVAVALARLKQPDLVMDVLAEPVRQGGFRIRLVDMGLLGPRTDTGLFAWGGPGQFDGSFRFRRAEVTVNMPIKLMDPEEQTLHPAAHLAQRKAAPPAPDDDTWSI